MACIRLLVLMNWFVLLSIKAWMFKTLLYCHLRYLIVIFFFKYIYIYPWGRLGRVTPILGEGYPDPWDGAGTGKDKLPRHAGLVVYGA